MVHVTVVPALTVNVAGTKAKPSMLTWLPLTGAAGAVTDIEAIGMLVLVPAVGREAEQPANTTLAANAATKCFRSTGISMPTDRAVGYTA